MEAKCTLYDVEVFGKNDTKKAVFLDLSTMDKVSMLVSDDVAKELLPNKGKTGILTIGLKEKGYDFSVRYVSFKGQS